MCIGSVNKMVVTGTHSGHLYVWEGRNCKKAVHAHNDTLSCLHTVEGPEGGIVTGSRDGKVRLWNTALEPGALFEIGGLGGLLSAVRSVCWDIEQGKVLVGTAGSEVYELSSNDGAGEWCSKCSTDHLCIKCSTDHLCIKCSTDHLCIKCITKFIKCSKGS
jgi:microtubule-associated protein-like 6